MMARNETSYISLLSRVFIAGILCYRIKQIYNHVEVLIGLNIRMALQQFRLEVLKKHSSIIFLLLGLV